MEKHNQFYFNKETFELVADVDADENCTHITSLEDLLKIDRPSLRKIRSNIFGGETPADSKKASKVLAKQIIAEIGRTDKADEPVDKPDLPINEPPPVDEQDPVTGKVKKVKKMDLIKAVVQEKGTISRADLAVEIGSDERNTHTMVSILGNAKRTKVPVKISYNKKDKTYSWPK